MAKKDKKTKLQLVVNKDTKPKQNNVKKVVNQAKFKDLSMEEQDKILDRIIDGVNEGAAHPAGGAANGDTGSHVGGLLRGSMKCQAYQC